MHAFIIASRSINNLQLAINNLATEHKAKQLPFTLQKIDDSRELKKITKFVFAQKTAIVIRDIDTATDEALNSVLKNLEEPSDNLIYILTAKNIENVLATIVSRCQVIKTAGSEQRMANSKTTNILEIKDRDEAIDLVNNLIFIDKEKDKYNNMENYLNTLSNLKANGNVSLQLTNLLAKMNNHG